MNYAASLPNFFARQTFSAAIAICLALAAIGHARPNVLFIISDDLSAEALSCYGNTQCQTPHIDRLAKQGVQFSRAYCQFPVCGPSRAALMGGMYPQATGVVGNGSAGKFTTVMGNRPSMSQHFRNHGYYSARVSKIYHMRVPGDITAGVDGPDHIASWTERFNCQGPEWMTEGEHAHLTNEKLNRDPEKHYNLGFGGAFYVVRGSGNGAEQPDVQAANKAIALMEAHRDQPFFLAVGLVRPHVPLVAPAAYYTPYSRDAMKLPDRIDGDWDDIPKLGISKSSKSSGLDGERTKQQDVLSAYYASVTFMDAQVGRMIEALDQLGLRDNTIVVFTSDHGYHLGEHDFWQKMSLHEESTRIPLVLGIPQQPAKTVEGLAQQIDIYPTLAELSGLPIPDHCQGKSQVAAIRGNSVTTHEFVYCYKGNGHLIRTPQYAYLSWKDGTSELYDMEVDPQQFDNLAEQTSHRQVREAMHRQLGEFLGRIEPAN